MSDYCEKCNLLLLTDKERKTGLCRFCLEKIKKLPKIGVVVGEQVLLFKKDYFKKP